MMRSFLLLLLCASLSQASEIQWTRLRGTVKAINARTQMLTIQNPDGDLLTMHIDADVEMLNGKDPILKLQDFKLGDKVTLLYNPKAPAPKDSEDTPEFKR